MATCPGALGHCCWLDTGVCVFLRHDGTRYLCTLREELGSWDRVHSDARYLAVVRPFWERVRPEMDCGDWPGPGETCNECGVVG